MSKSDATNLLHCSSCSPLSYTQTFLSLTFFIMASDAECETDCNNEISQQCRTKCESPCSLATLLKSDIMHDTCIPSPAILIHIYMSFEPLNHSSVFPNLNPILLHFRLSSRTSSPTRGMRIPISNPYSHFYISISMSKSKSFFRTTTHSNISPALTHQKTATA